jgi:tetratricopeptide (TPR) repeat protein
MNEPASPANQPASPVAQALQAAIRLHRRGQLRQADSGYEQVLRMEPTNPDALHLRGLIAAQTGNPNPAIELVRRAIARNPSSPPYHNTLGLALAATGDLAGAQGAFAEALNLDPRYADAHVNAGNLMRRQDNPDGALAHYREAVAAQPKNAPALCLLGNLLIERGEAQAGLPHLEEAVKLRPDDADVQASLGAALVALGRPNAQETLEKALSLRADHVGALRNLALFHRESGRTEQAVTHYRQAAAFAPKDGTLKSDLGQAYISLGRLEEAKASLQQALAQDPRSASAHLGFSRLYRVMGDFGNAVAHAEAALAIDPAFVQALLSLADLDASRLTDRHWREIEKLADDPRLSTDDRSRLHFGLFERDQAAEADERAFGHLRQANELKRAHLARKGRTFEATSMASAVDHLIKTCDAAYFASAAQAGNHSERPIFIVGMPRSGTTLCEQILASHSQVFGAGELRDIPIICTNALARARDAAPSAPTPEAALQQSTSIIREAAEAYLVRLNQLSRDARHVTDKLPDNFLRLGFIATLFPRARIVHCRRDPMDTCLSCYATAFGDATPWAWDLASIGRYYQEYERLMAHWRAVLPNPVFDFVYEDVVNEPEASTRGLVKFCGLEWEDSCLAFYKTERPVNTASWNQVRRPIYKDSIGRWRRYEAELAPLRKVLEA